MKKWMFLLLPTIAAIAGQPMLAYENAAVAPQIIFHDHYFSYEGIKYRVIDEEYKTCETAWNCILEEGKCDHAGHIDIPEVVYEGDTQYKVVQIGYDSFEQVTEIESVTLPESVMRIGEYAFYGCSNLANINFPYGLETIGSMAFNGCSLEDIEFPETLKIIEIGEDLHEGPGTEHYYAGTFADNKFKRLVFPDGMESIGTQAFEKCHNLEYVRLPKHLRHINEGTFSDCENLKEIALPESLEFIGKYAFANCSSLKSIEVPNGVKTLKADWYFDPYGWDDESSYYPLSSGLWYLKKLTLPESLEALSAAVFSGSSIEEVYYMTSSPKNIENIYEKWNYGTFNNNTYQNGTLYVGIGGSAAARMTEPWKNFVNIKEIDMSGVEEVSADVSGGRTLHVEVYDLQGRKVAVSEEGLPSGLYVIKEGSNVRKVRIN